MNNDKADMAGNTSGVLPGKSRFRFRPGVVVGSLVVAVVIGALGCASQSLMAADPALQADAAAVKATLLQSFKAKNEAGLDRLDQTEEQKVCSEHAMNPLPVERLWELEEAALAKIVYPADGTYLGDWKKGQALAIRGTGMTYNDPKGAKVYGNCYACHQLETAEVSYGNIGPSLNHYGRKRALDEKNLRYTWGRIWNSHAFKACNPMPRFGAAGILSESDLKDLMALLLDPNSVVNQ